MKRVIRLTEGDLKKIIKKVITEKEDDFDVKLFVKRRIPFINKLLSGEDLLTMFKGFMESSNDAYEYRDNATWIICDFLYRESRVDFTNPQYDDMFEFVRELYGDILVDQYHSNQPMKSD